ncbi:MAG: hypothetical protein JO053_15365, partial [Acidobacteria bacterium]|nr:hypothetical protein [Acidobacteriota bacterium]
MKKKSVILAAVISSAAVLSTLAYTVGTASWNSAPGDHDQELAATIRRMTNRSTSGLVEKKLPHGGRSMDLMGRFEDLALVKLDPEGDPAVGCVTSIEEANHFFGRNLETGEVYPTSPTDTEEYLRTKHAMSSDMSIEEFLQYKEMIRRAAPRLRSGVTSDHSLADSPNSASADPTGAALTSQRTVINIVNNDGAGEGFNDTSPMTPEGGNNGTTLGDQRLNLFNFAASIWASYIDSTVPINVKAQFDPLTPCSTSGGVLGSAGTTSIYRDFTGAEFSGTWYPAALTNKIMGADQDGTTAEINAKFNSSVDTGCLGTGTRFYYGLDNSTPSKRINLLVVLLHELGHGLGFQTFVSGSTGVQNSGFTDIFARHIYDRTSGKFWNQMTDTERKNSALNNGNLLWEGPNVDIASGGLTAGRDNSNGRVQLYAPSTYESGSSVSHWDTAATPNLLMEPIINTGLPLDLDLTKQQLRDIGWYRDVNGDRVPDTISSVAVNGTTLQPGTTATVTWVNGGGFAGNVSVELSTDGGTTFPTALGINITNTGSFDFTVPNSVTSTAQVRVREYNFVSPAGASSNFSIGSGTPTPTPTPTPGGTRTNVALATNGGTASASSYSSGGYSPAGTINGDRTGANWGNDTGWNDGTAYTFPDWLEVDFAGTKTIDEIDVFSVQDNYANPSQPTNTMVFTQYGLTSFDVQYWTGSAWATVPGGSITNNNKVWVQVGFTAIATSKIRILVNNALAAYSRVTELEAWQTAAGGTPT